MLLINKRLYCDNIFTQAMYHNWSSILSQTCLWLSEAHYPKINMLLHIGFVSLFGMSMWYALQQRESYNIQCIRKITCTISTINNVRASSFAVPNNINLHIYGVNHLPFTLCATLCDSFFFFSRCLNKPLTSILCWKHGIKQRWTSKRYFVFYEDEKLNENQNAKE